VKVLGYVENLSAVYEQCLTTGALIYPGGGTCIKVSESLLRGPGSASNPISRSVASLRTGGSLETAS